MTRGSRLYTSGLYLISISLCGRLQADDDGLVLGTRVQFVDVAAEVGVTLMNVSGDGEQQYVVDAFIGGSAFFDYDRDGDLDLYVLNGSRVGGFPGRDRPRNALYRNEGATFSNATEESGLGDTGWGMGCAVADYDNDGDADIYVTNYGSNALYENRGDGAFADVAQRAGVLEMRHSAPDVLSSTTTAMVISTCTWRTTSISIISWKPLPTGGTSGGD